MSHQPLSHQVNPRDVLALDALLNQDEVLLRDTVRRFVGDRILPEVADWYERGTFPKEMALEFGRLGLLGMHLEGYGCAGTSATAYGLACLELEAGDSGARSFVSVQGSLAMFPIWAFGSEDQKQRWLPAMATGEAIGCFGLTEPDSGSDPSSMRTFAKQQPGGDWILNGTKMWITNGPDADTLVVYAKTEPELGARGVTAFLIEKGMPGFSVAQKLDKLGMRGSHTGELVFNNVEVPEQNILGNLNGGAKVLMSGLDYERAVLTGGPLGIMQSVMDSVLPYIHDRKQFGQSIGEFQLIQGKVADMYTTLQAGRAFAYTVAKNLDLLGSEHVRQVRKDCASVILWCAEKATWMAGEGIQIFGGNGYINDYPLGRLWRDAKLYEIGAGTSEIRRMLIGRELFAETM